MLNYAEDVLKEITDYLTWQHIPYRARDSIGIVTFVAETMDSDNKYHYRVDVGEDALCVEVTAPLEVPKSEKIQVRLLKFLNVVQCMDRRGGALALNREKGKLLCCMMIPFSCNRCGRIDQILPVPASMLEHYSGAIRRLIQGKSSVEKESKTISWYWEISPLVSSAPAKEEYPFLIRRSWAEQKKMEEVIFSILSREDREN